MEAKAKAEVTRVEVAAKGAAAMVKATNGGGGVFRSGWVAFWRSRTLLWRFRGGFWTFEVRF